MLKNLLLRFVNSFLQPRTLPEPIPNPSIYLQTADGMSHNAIGTELKIGTDLRIYTKIKNKWVLAPEITAVVYQNNNKN